jgi:putative transposase
MATANPTWGAPRVHGELKKLGFKISERTVSRLMPKKTGKPSQTWMTFLRNHVSQMVSVDFFTVPTIQLRVLYVFVILAHDRRRVLHFNVTENPTAAWAAQQIVEAFPEETVPRYLIRDRDGIYGHDFTTRVDGLGIQQVPISARSPWQNCYAERMIGSIRRECLNHVIVINEWHLRRILKSYFSYYHRSRTHLSLDKDAPESSGSTGWPDHSNSGGRRIASSLRTPGRIASDAFIPIDRGLFLFELASDPFALYVPRSSGAGDRGDASTDSRVES